MTLGLKKLYVAIPVIIVLSLIPLYAFILQSSSQIEGRSIWGIPSDKLPTSTHPQTRPPSVTAGMMKQVLHDGRMMFYVNEESKVKSIGEGANSITASPGHEFIVVDLYIMNMGERPITFSSNSLSLITDARVSYHPTVATQLLKNGFVTTQIPASQVARGEVAFEVPDGLTALWLYFTDYSSGFQVEMKSAPIRESPPASTFDGAVPVGQTVKDARLEITISAKTEVEGNRKRISVDATIGNLAEYGFQVNREYFHMISKANYMYCPIQGEAGLLVLPKEKVTFRGLVFSIPAESEGLFLIYSDYGSRFAFKLAE